MVNILLVNPSQRQKYKNYPSSSFFHSVLKFSTIAALAKKNSHKINIRPFFFRKFALAFVLSAIKGNFYNIVGFIGATSISASYSPFKRNKENRDIFSIGDCSHFPAMPEGNIDKADIDLTKLNLQA